MVEEYFFTGQPMLPIELTDKSLLLEFKKQIRIVSIEEARTDLSIIQRSISHLQSIRNQVVNLITEIEIVTHKLPFWHSHVCELVNYLGDHVREWQKVNDIFQKTGAQLTCLEFGHVSWYGVVDRKLVMFSWYQDEVDIEWWYPLGTSTSERRPLIEA